MKNAIDAGDARRCRRRRTRRQPVLRLGQGADATPGRTYLWVTFQELKKGPTAPQFWTAETMAVQISY